MAVSLEAVRNQKQRENCVTATEDDGKVRFIFSDAPMDIEQFLKANIRCFKVEPRNDGKPGTKLTLGIVDQNGDEATPRATVSVKESPDEIEARLHARFADAVRANEWLGDISYVATRDFHKIGGFDVRLKCVSYKPTFFGGEVKIDMTDRSNNLVEQRVVNIEDTYAQLCVKLKASGYVLRLPTLENATVTDRYGHEIVIHGTEDGEIVRTVFIGPRSDGDRGSEIFRVWFDERGNKLRSSFCDVQEGARQVNAILRSVGEEALPMKPSRIPQTIRNFAQRTPVAAPQ